MVLDLSRARYGADDYRRAFMALLPQGMALSPDDAGLQALQLALVQSHVRMDAEAQQLLADVFPGTTLAFLSDWETTLGLTGQFDGEVLTQQQRQQLVIRRLIGGGVWRPLDIIALAALFGYDTGLVKYPVARAGITRAGGRVFSDDWAFVIGIAAPSTTVARAVAGSACAGEPLAVWGNNALEHELTAALPGHIVPVFIYVDGVPLVTPAGYCLVDDEYEPITA